MDWSTEATVPNSFAQYLRIAAGRRPRANTDDRKEKSSPAGGRRRGGRPGSADAGAHDSGRRMRTTEPFSTERGDRRVRATPRDVESCCGATRALAVAAIAARIMRGRAISLAETLDQHRVDFGGAIYQTSYTLVRLGDISGGVA